MLNLIIEDIKKTTAKYLPGLKNAPWMVARHAFLFILLFVLLEGLVCSWLYYKYVFIQNSQTVEAGSPAGVFKEKMYQSVLQSWETRRQIIENSVKEAYNNPF